MTVVAPSKYILILVGGSCIFLFHKPPSTTTFPGKRQLARIFCLATILEKLLTKEINADFENGYTMETCISSNPEIKEQI